MAIKPSNASATDLAPDQIAGQATLPHESSDLASDEGLATELTLVHVVLISLIVGIFSVVWLVTYSKLNDLIWKNNFVAANRWMIPVIVVFFSLLVGLAQKYLHAPNVIREGAPEALAAGDYYGYRTFWGALCSSFVSLFSGASIGPEGPLGVLAIDVSEWLAIRLKLRQDDMLPAGLAGVSAAYNGIVGSPIFSAVYASEQPTGRLRKHVLGSNLLAGAVGFLLFTLLKVPPFAGLLDLGEQDVLTLGWIAWALVLGVLGALIGAYIGVAFQVFGKLMGRFDDRVIVRSLIAGVIIGIVGYLIPDLLFSGEGSIQRIVANPAEVGLALLLLMALLKPLLLALAFKSGYLGGPIFPSLFTAVMVGLAISLLAPQVPLSILIACLEVAVTTLLLRAPLTSILLVGLLARAGSGLLGLITVSAVTAMLLGRALQSAREQRAANNAQP